MVNVWNGLKYIVEDMCEKVCYKTIHSYGWTEIYKTIRPVSYIHSGG